MEQSTQAKLDAALAKVNELRKALEDEQSRARAAEQAHVSQLAAAASAAASAVERMKEGMEKAVKEAATAKAAAIAAKDKGAAAMAELQAVHRHTILQSVETQIKERRAEEAKQRKAEEKAAQKTRQEETRTATLQEQRTAATLTAAAHEVRSMRTTLGMANAQLERYRRAEARRAEQASADGSGRKRLAELTQEVSAARELVPELRERIRSLEAQQPLQQRVAPLPSVPTAKLLSPRTSASPDAPLTARSLEYLRRITEECNVSFEGASTAVALVLSMYLEGGPSKEQLVNSSSVKHAFEKLGMLDNDKEKLSNLASKEFWAMGCDGGNKGRAIEMIAYSMWDPNQKRPVTRPLAASDLFCDQTASNGVRTLLRATERLGLKAEMGVSNTSDGTEHAVQESENFLAELEERASRVDERRSSKEHCAIHGKALEENAGMELMMPGGRLVNALRLLWEIVKSPEGGRHDEYREAWVKDAGIPGVLFDLTLGSMAEPTSAKWQVTLA